LVGEALEWTALVALQPTVNARITEYLETELAHLGITGKLLADSALEYLQHRWTRQEVLPGVLICLQH